MNQDLLIFPHPFLTQILHLQSLFPSPQPLRDLFPFPIPSAIAGSFTPAETEYKLKKFSLANDSTARTETEIKKLIYN